MGLTRKRVARLTIELVSSELVLLAKRKVVRSNETMKAWTGSKSRARPKSKKYKIKKRGLLKDPVEMTSKKVRLVKTMASRAFKSLPTLEKIIFRPK